MGMLTQSSPLRHDRHGFEPGDREISSQPSYAEQACLSCNVSPYSGSWPTPWRGVFVHWGVCTARGSLPPHHYSKDIISEHLDVFHCSLEGQSWNPGLDGVRSKIMTGSTGRLSKQPSSVFATAYIMHFPFCDCGQKKHLINLDSFTICPKGAWLTVP